MVEPTPLLHGPQTRPVLKDWLDTRVQAIIDGTVPNADRTFVYYWLNDGRLGENFRRKDIVFECFHSFLALSQWGNMVYHPAARLAPDHGDVNVRVQQHCQAAPADQHGSAPLEQSV